MKVLHINHSDEVGGAARAAYRLHSSLRIIDVESRMRVIQATSRDWTIIGPKNKFDRLRSTSLAYAGALISKAASSSNRILHTPSLFSAISASEINSHSVDIVNLHWLGKETLSISQISRINKPLIWTLHDMWAFCGAEHVTEDDRWREGYSYTNRPAGESRFDINSWTWNRKKRTWKIPIHIVSPSRWLADCVRKSNLMADWPITVIPNPIDTYKWCPVEKTEARSLLQLPIEKKLILFGAIGGTGEKNKGFGHLEATLKILKNNQGIEDLELVILGERTPENPKNYGFPTHYLGHFHDDISLRLLFSAADAVVIPSRIENLPNMALEAHACGTPVVAFNIGGLPDIVSHRESGYLARPYDEKDLASGIEWVLSNKNITKIRDEARRIICKNFNYDIISNKYLCLYQDVVKLNSLRVRGIQCHE